MIRQMKLASVFFQGEYVGNEKCSVIHSTCYGLYQVTQWNKGGQRRKKKENEKEIKEFLMKNNVHEEHS